MSTVTFDTHYEIKELIAKGIPETQAEAITQTIKRAQDTHIDQLATKMDVVEIKGELKLVKWMLGLLMAGVAALILKSFF